MPEINEEYIASRVRDMVNELARRNQETGMPPSAICLWLDPSRIFKDTMSVPLPTPTGAVAGTAVSAGAAEGKKRAPRSPAQAIHIFMSKLAKKESVLAGQEKEILYSLTGYESMNDVPFTAATHLAKALQYCVGSTPMNEIAVGQGGWCIREIKTGDIIVKAKAHPRPPFSVPRAFAPAAPLGEPPQEGGPPSDDSF